MCETYSETLPVSPQGRSESGQGATLGWTRVHWMRKLARKSMLTGCPRLKLASGVPYTRSTKLPGLGGITRKLPVVRSSSSRWQKQCWLYASLSASAAAE